MPFVEERTTTRADSESAGSPRAGREDETAGGFHFSSWAEARAEAVRRRADPAREGFVTRVVESPYGGYVVRSFPLDLLLDAGFPALLRGASVRYQDL